MKISRRSLGDGYYYFISLYGTEVVGTGTHGSRSACVDYIEALGIPVVFEAD